MFAGFVNLEGTMDLVVGAKSSSNVPINTDALPTFRIYDANGLVPNATGTASFKDSLALTGASNASPIAITSVGHGLSTGTRVTITGVTGNTNANTTTTITRVDADHFTLDGIAGNAAYVSGGVWNVTGLYHVSVACTAAAGFASGETYTVLVTGAIAATAWAELVTFIVG